MNKPPDGASGDEITEVAESVADMNGQFMIYGQNPQSWWKICCPSTTVVYWAGAKSRLFKGKAPRHEVLWARKRELSLIDGFPLDFDGKTWQVPEPEDGMRDANNDRPCCHICSTAMEKHSKGGRTCDVCNADIAAGCWVWGCTQGDCDFDLCEGCA